MRKIIFISLAFLTINVVLGQLTDTGDNVGIGITNPVRKAHINENSSSVQFRMERSGSNTGIADIGVDGDGLHFWVGGYDSFGNEELFISTNGYVGFGTDTPARKLHIARKSGSAQFRLERTSTSQGLVDIGADNNGLHFWVGGYNGFGNEELFVGTDGNVGIGTSNPGSTKLKVNGTIRGATSIAVENGGSYRVSMNGSSDGNIVGRDNASQQKFVITSNGSSFFNGGDVGIGTTTPDAKLAVNGNIHAQEVRVDLIGWPDYVFKKDYDLPSLKEVERHIKTKGHLINIPSAKEVEENGVQLGEMNRLLLKKIEELTLYIIAQEKRITILEKTLKENKL